MNTRTDEYIDEVLAQFAELWKRNREMRFCQLIDNALYSKTNYDIFYTEDIDLLKIIKEFSDRRNQ